MLRFVGLCAFNWQQQYLSPLPIAALCAAAEELLVNVLAKHQWTQGMSVTSCWQHLLRVVLGSGLLADSR